MARSWQRWIFGSPVKSLSPYSGTWLAAVLYSSRRVLQGFHAAPARVEDLPHIRELDDGPIAHAWASSVRHFKTTRESSCSARSERKPRRPTDSIVATQMSMRPT